MIGLVLLVGAGAFFVLGKKRPAVDPSKLRGADVHSAFAAKAFGATDNQARAASSSKSNGAPCTCPDGKASLFSSYLGECICGQSNMPGWVDDTFETLGRGSEKFVDVKTGGAYSAATSGQIDQQTVSTGAAHARRNAK